MFGIPESEIAETLRVARREGVDLDALEITTCLRRGEVEVVTRYEPAGRRDVRGVRRAIVRERHADTLFSDDGTSVDEQVARAADASAAGRSPPPSRAPAGCSPARLTELAGLVGVRPRRARRLRERGEDRAGRRRRRR